MPNGDSGQPTTTQSTPAESSFASSDNSFASSASTFADGVNGDGNAEDRTVEKEECRHCEQILLAPVSWERGYCERCPSTGPVMICPHCQLRTAAACTRLDFCIERLAEILERVPITGGMILPRSNVNHDAYRKGLCCDCSTVPYSPGRPRCHSCHEAWLASQPIFMPQLHRGQLGSCVAPGCSNPPCPARCSARRAPDESSASSMMPRQPPPHERTAAHDH